MRVFAIFDRNLIAGYDGGLDPRQSRDLKVPEYSALVHILSCLCCTKLLYEMVVCLVLSFFLRASNASLSCLQIVLAETVMQIVDLQNFDHILYGDLI